VGWSVVHVIVAESFVIPLTITLVITGRMGARAALAIIVRPGDIVPEKVMAA
jgi:hypothetical protein